MSQAISSPQEQFQLLIAAFSERINAPLDASDGMVVLVNDDQTLGMIIELSTDRDAIFVILPILPFPDDRSAMGEMAIQALLLNADRAALNGACICADAHHSRFCLIRHFSLELDPLSFIQASEELADLAGLVRQYLQLTDGDSFRPPVEEMHPDFSLKI
jgi:hypothetical protein